MQINSIRQWPAVSDPELLPFAFYVGNPSWIPVFREARSALVNTLGQGGVL
jgi:hypothetical protein